MASCTMENWILESLAAALQDMHKDNKKIAVPMCGEGQFQTEFELTESKP